MKFKIFLHLAITTCASFSLMAADDQQHPITVSSSPATLVNNMMQTDGIPETIENTNIFSPDEIQNAPLISSGSFVAPSEPTTTRFIEHEGLDLFAKGGMEAFGEATPRIGLSIDGGGIRGVMPALWLRTLKMAYAEEGEEGIQDPLCKIFDYVGGTSIGGIVSLGVAAGLEPDTIVEMFEKNRTQIFSTEGRRVVRFLDFFGLFGHRYAADNLASLLKTTFGEDQKLSDLKTNILITACTSDGHPWLFKKEEDPNKNYRLWEVARSTSAAPTYFDAYQPIFPIQQNRPTLVDGGIWVNNPSVLITASIVKEFHDGGFNPNNIHLLSLGTGDTHIEAISRSAGKLSAEAIIEALMSSHSRGNHMLMNQLLGDHYHRINAEMTKAIDLADVSDDSYKAMKKYADQQEHENKIKNFVEQTKSIVRARLEKKD